MCCLCGYLCPCVSMSWDKWRVCMYTQCTVCAVRCMYGCTVRSIRQHGRILWRLPFLALRDLGLQQKLFMKAESCSGIKERDPQNPCIVALSFCWCQETPRAVEHLRSCNVQRYAGLSSVRAEADKATVWRQSRPNFYPRDQRGEQSHAMKRKRPTTAQLTDTNHYSARMLATLD